ncbi:MAG: hypothetical protein GY862_00395 [Gammaproteobacteria bacterium]|nr:hypothetical protein [Gammaproteobacteria bacterium]
MSSSTAKHSLGVLWTFVSGALLFYFVAAGLAHWYELMIAVGVVVIIQGALYFMAVPIVDGPVKNLGATMLGVFVIVLSIFATSYFISVSAAKSAKVMAKKGERYADISLAIAGIDESLVMVRDRLAGCPANHRTRCIVPAQTEIRELNEQKRGLLADRAAVPADSAAETFWQGMGKWAGLPVDALIVLVALLRAALLDLCGMWLVGTAHRERRGRPVLISVFPDELAEHGRLDAALRRVAMDNAPAAIEQQPSGEMALCPKP